MAKAETHSAYFWAGFSTVTVSFESNEDKEALTDYIENKLPEDILNRLSVEEVYNLLGKKLFKLENDPY